MPKKPSMPIIEREFDVADWGDVEPPRYDDDAETALLREEQLQASGVELLSPTEGDLEEAKRGARRRRQKVRKPPAEDWSEEKHGRDVLGQFRDMPDSEREPERRVQSVKATGDRLPELEKMLPIPFEVRVSEADNSWASPGIHVVHIARWAVDLLTKGKPGDISAHNQMPWAMAVYTLYHEFWHAAMEEENEKQTDVGSLTIMRDMMRRYWGLSEKEAQKQYEYVAGKVGVTGPAYTPYHPEYTPTARDPVLGDAEPAEKLLPDRSWSEVSTKQKRKRKTKKK